MKEKKIVYLALGDIQGIGFRDKVKEEAKKRGLSCSAENIPPPERKVRIELEGKWIDVVKMASWIRSIEGVDGLVSFPVGNKEASASKNNK